MRKAFATVAAADVRRYWIAVVRGHNLDALVLKNDLAAYAASEGQGGRVHRGDEIALYKSRRPGTGGIVGVFEVIEDPTIDRQTAFSRLYQVKIPWRPKVISLVRPLSLKMLAPELTFIANKRNYGSVLQRSWVQIPEDDFRLIEAAARAHVSELERSNPAAAINLYHTALTAKSITD